MKKTFIRLFILVSIFSTNISSSFAMEMGDHRLLGNDEKPINSQEKKAKRHDVEEADDSGSDATSSSNSVVLSSRRSPSPSSSSLELGYNRVSTHISNFQQGLITQLPTEILYQIALWVLKTPEILNDINGLYSRRKSDFRNLAEFGKSCRLFRVIEKSLPKIILSKKRNIMVTVEIKRNRFLEKNRFGKKVGRKVRKCGRAIFRRLPFSRTQIVVTTFGVLYLCLFYNVARIAYLTYLSIKPVNGYHHIVYSPEIVNQLNETIAFLAANVSLLLGGGIILYNKYS